MKKKLPQGITHRKDGRYMWRFQHEGVSYSGYSAHLKDAEIAMYRKKYEVYNHLCERMTTPTMNQWFLEWMTIYKKNCKAVTAYSYWKAYKNYIADELGNYRLDQIPTREIQETMNYLSDRYSPTVINTSRVLLYGMLEQARKNAMIEFNPMKNISRPKTQEKPKKQVLTAEEELIFLNAALPSFYYPLYKLATLTGMRIGEITALRWNDIDMENRLIHVRHTLDYTAEKGLFLETPKTKSSKRDIPMISAAAELLAEHRKEQKRLLHEVAMNAAPDRGDEDVNACSAVCVPALSPDYRVKNGTKVIPNLVFTSPCGKPIYQACVQKDLSKIITPLLANNSISHSFTFHTLRHCFATRCIENGMSYKTLQSILGHSSLSTTMDIYAHSLDETRRGEMEKVASYLDHL